jgi:hypothetical protein
LAWLRGEGGTVTRFGTRRAGTFIVVGFVTAVIGLVGMSIALLVAGLCVALPAVAYVAIRAASRNSDSIVVAVMLAAATVAAVLTVIAVGARLA